MFEKGPNFEPTPEDDEPVVEIGAPGGEFELRPSDTYIVMHTGKNKIYDYIYHENEEDSMYIFSEVDIFQPLVETLIEMGFPAYINMQEVAKEDKEHYTNMVLQQMWNGIPKEYLGEE